MLLEIPPKVSVVSFMGILKGGEQPDDLWKVPAVAIQISKQRVLYGEYHANHVKNLVSLCKNGSLLMYGD